MFAEVLTIGDELCRGEIVDTNSSWLAAQLWDLDVTCAWLTSCRDVAADMEAALRLACGRAELVIVSGGLGPTLDDLTVDVVAGLVGAAPEVHEPSRRRMEARFEAASYRLTPDSMRQVRAPAGARVYDNPAGLAPGFEVELGGVPVICLPGPPRELKGIFEGPLRERVVELRERGGAAERIARRIYRVFGRGESHVATMLEGCTDGVTGASLHYQVSFPELLVKVVVRDRDGAAAAARLDSVDQVVRERLGSWLYGLDEGSMAAVLVRALEARGLTLASAESCTGGLLGARITDVPGASRVYLGGAVTYADREKVRQLGVRPETLAARGAVSEDTVREMAAGMRERAGADLAVAVSGVAGPGGGTEDKPVGTVWLAVAGPGPDQVTAKKVFWPGARDQVRLLSAYWAMALVMRALAGQGPGGEPAVSLPAGEDG